MTTAATATTVTARREAHGSRTEIRFEVLADGRLVADALPKSEVRKVLARRGIAADVAYHPDVDAPDWNLVTSLCEDGRHRPALDIDVPMVVVPSTTPGHHHVYFPTIDLDWDEYHALLLALARAGIIGPGYATKSIQRKMTRLRAPEVAKVDGWGADSDETAVPTLTEILAATEPKADEPW